MMRCAVVYAPMLDVGGVEKHLLQLFQAPCEVSWHVFSRVSDRFRQQAAAYPVEFVEWAPCSVWDFAALRSLIRQLRSLTPSLVHVHSPEASLLAKVAAWALRLPLFVTIHLAPSEYFRGTRLLARLKKRIYLSVDSWLNLRKATQIIFCSAQVMHSEVRKFFYPAQRIHLVPNGVDISAFSAERRNRAALRKEFGLAQDSVAICFVGRQAEQKGFDILLSAFARLQKLGTVLWAIGVEAAPFDRAAYPNVVFWGVRQDVTSLLAAADIFAAPSRYEGMPIALMEAMAAELACVATPVGENQALIRHGHNGLLVPVEDAVTLAAALSELVDDKERRQQLARAALETIRAFDVRAMVERTLALYAKAVARTGAGV